MFYYFVIFILFVFIWHQWKIYNYWRKKGIPGPTPLPIVGNFGLVLFGLKREIEILTEIYNKYPNEKCVGIHVGIKPALLLRDPQMIKQIFTKDFESFHERFITEAAKSYQKSLFVSRGGNTWWLIRQALAPMFANVKLKHFVSKINSTLNAYYRFIDKSLEKEKDVEIYTLSERYIRSVILNVVIGKENYDFIKRTKLEQMAVQAADVETLQVLRVLECIPYIPKIVGPLLKYKTNQAYNYFTNLVSIVVEEMTSESSIKKHSFLEYILGLKEKGKFVKKRNKLLLGLDIDDEVIFSSISTIMAGSIPSMSIIMTALFHELALNEVIQEKCYEEIKLVINKYNNELTWDAVCELKYLEMVLNEALRKYSPLVIDRKCTSDYKYPETDFIIDKGVMIFVALDALHYDPNYFENPDLFDPERFSCENKNKIPSGVFKPFGEGPRFCIGNTFAKLVMIMGVAGILNRFKLKPTELTVKQIGTKTTVRSRRIEGDVFVSLEKRDF